MDEAGILDPLFVIGILFRSTEAAISVLRINDVLWAKQDPTTRWNEEELRGMTANIEIISSTILPKS